MGQLINWDPSDRPTRIMTESRQEECLAIVGVFTVLAYIFIAVRLWSRYLGRNFGWDDYLIIFAGFCMLGQTITIWKWVLLSGTGYHVWDLPKKSVQQQITNNQWNLAIQMMYHPLMGSIRASIIMFLFRMKDNRRRIRYSLHIVFWLNILYAVGTSLGNILQCLPVHYTWAKPGMDYVDASGKLVAGGSCINSRTFVLVSCALSIFMDLIIIPIPSVMVWNLQMEVRTKILVVIVMSLGWVATGVSVGRFIVYYYRFAPTNFDRTWNIGIAISIAEPSVHIMSACAPATKCLFRYLFPYFVRSRTPAYYEDRQTTNQTPRMSKFGSRGSRHAFGSFNFGLSNGASRHEDTVMEGIAVPGPTLVHNSNDERTYDLRRLSSINSQVTMKDLHSEEKERHGSLETHDTAQSNHTKTATTSLNEPVEAEPSHCLARTQ